MPRPKRKPDADGTYSGYATYEEYRRAYKTQHEAETLAAKKAVAIPACTNPTAVIKQRHDLEFFLQEFFPNSTGLKPFGKAQKKAIAAMQYYILKGGRLCQAFPRGFAKTAISVRAAIWAILNGHRKYVAIFGAADENAKNLIDAIQMELSENPLLRDAFPWLQCFWALEGKTQRCASQAVMVGEEAQLTHIVFRADKIVMPTVNMVPEGWPMDEWPIDGCPFSSGLIHAKSMRSARGLQFTTPEGIVLRPDLFILDDIQTDEDAISPTQVRKIVNKVKKGILRSGGHAQSPACIKNCTVIAKDDVAETFLNDNSFQSIRYRMVEKWPEEEGMKLWEGEYRNLLLAYDSEDETSMTRAKKRAMEFYAENREVMDFGSEVTWDWCFEWAEDDVVEISALQHAFNILYLDGQDVFDTECQNDTSAVDGRILLDEKSFLAKVHGSPKHLRPDTEWTLCHIDVQSNLLWYAVAGLSPLYGGRVVEWSSWPQQRADYYTTANAKAKLADVYGYPSEDENLWAGLTNLCQYLTDAEWPIDEGESTKRIDLILIDSGYKTQLINQFCHHFKDRFKVIPAHGIGLTEKSVPMAEMPDVKKGERRGWHVEVRYAADKTAADKYQKYLKVDTNHFKTLVHERLLSGFGSPSSWEVSDYGRQRNLLLCDHVLSETPELRTCERTHRKVDVWTPRQLGMVENHLFDNLVGIAAGASLLGAKLQIQVQSKTRKRVSQSDVRGERIRGRRRA